MRKEIQKLADAANILDKIGEVKLASQLDKVMEKLAADPIAQLKQMDANQIVHILNGGDPALAQELVRLRVWDGAKVNVADMPSVARDILSNIQLLPEPDQTATTSVPRDPQAGVPNMQPTSINDRWDGKSPQGSNAPVKPEVEHSKNKPAGPHQGMLAVQKLINQWLDTQTKQGVTGLQKLQENGNQGDARTWQLIKDKEMGFGLTPGTDFKNYTKLLSLLKSKMAVPAAVAPAATPANPTSPFKVPPRRDVPQANLPSGTTVNPGGSLGLNNR